MTPTAWDDLPNAKHIDRILADLKLNPDKWSAAWDAEWYAASLAAWNAARTAASDTASDATWDAERDDAWNAAINAARTAAWTAERTAASDAAWYATRDAAWYAAWGATSALIAYNDCAYLLDEKPEHVQMLALLGNQAASLLYPACIALQKEMA
jgi:hypothetical protein